MSVLIAIFTLLGTTVLITFIGSHDLGLGSGTKVFIVLPFVLLFVYTLARIPPKKEKTAAEAQSLLLRLFDKSPRPLSRH
jgi:hypothetical protein